MPTQKRTMPEERTVLVGIGVLGKVFTETKHITLDSHASRMKTELGLSRVNRSEVSQPIDMFTDVDFSLFSALIKNAKVHCHKARFLF